NLYRLGKWVDEVQLRGVDSEPRVQSVEVQSSESLLRGQLGLSEAPTACQEKEGCVAAPPLGIPQTLRSQHQLWSLLVKLASQKEPPLLEKCGPRLHQIRLPSHLAEGLRHPRVSSGLLLHEIPEPPFGHGLPACHQLLAEKKEVVQRELLHPLLPPHRVQVADRGGATHGATTWEVLHSL